MYYRPFVAMLIQGLLCLCFLALAFAFSFQLSDRWLGVDSYTIHIHKLNVNILIYSIISIIIVAIVILMALAAVIMYGDVHTSLYSIYNSNLLRWLLSRPIKCVSLYKISNSKQSFPRTVYDHYCRINTINLEHFFLLLLIQNYISQA